MRRKNQDQEFILLYIILVAGWGHIKQNDDWKFHIYKETNLGYDMMCESVHSDQEEKEGDILKSNRIINLKNLITNIDKVLVCKQCAQERERQKKLEEERDVENFIDYVEAYFQLTPPDEQKGVRELHEDFNKQTYNRQTTSHRDSFCMSISEHSNGIASTIQYKYNNKKQDKRLSNNNFPLRLPKQTKHHSCEPRYAALIWYSINFQWVFMMQLIGGEGRKSTNLSGMLHLPQQGFEKKTFTKI